MTLGAFTVYFLILARIASFLYTGIFFSIKGIPNLAKIGFSLIFSYIIYLTVSQSVILSEDLIGYSLQVITETIYGMALGYTTYLIFITIQMAGQLIDIQIGFSIGAVYDPVTQNKVSIFGKFYYWLSIALFLSLDAHEYMIEAIAKSYNILPVGTAGLGYFTNISFVSIFTGSMKMAFQIALPLLMILFLTDFIMGLLARTVPQINVFILGLPMKVLIGITILIILIPSVADSMVDVIETLPYYLDKIIKNLVLKW